MRETITELRDVVSAYGEKLRQLSPEEFSAKPRPEKWSKQEVIGHLIDSAQNNLRRFVVGQYSADKIIYDQDFWVTANDYQNMKAEDVIRLWELINERIAAVLLQMPGKNYERQVDTGKGAPELHSVKWLAQDYVKHLKHHLNQVFAGAFNIVYP